jgi:ankyrin repeat protein
MNSLLQSCRRFWELFSSSLYQYAIANRCAEISQWTGKHGRVDTLERLIAGGSDAIIHGAATTPLFTAAEHGKEAVMRFLIEKGIDLNMRVTIDGRWYNAIHVAAKHGRTQIIRQLLDAGVEIDSESHYDSTAMVIAASQGHEGLVSYLFERGATVTARDGFERTALCWAAGNCSSPFFQKLLEKAPKELLQELLQDEDDLGRTPLSYAAECGNLGVVQLLVEQGTDLIGPNRKYTPLRVAIADERDDVVQFLLDAGACPNECQTPRQYAPLPLAAELGHGEAVRMLLEKGADFNYVLPWGDTPLQLAAWKGHYDVVKRLLDAGAPVDAGDYDNALASAIRHGNGEIALLLIQRGADRTTCSDQGPVTLLSLGVRNDDHELVNLLLGDGVDLEARNTYQGTALTIAAMNGRTEMVRALVKKGADVHIQDLFGRTPLAIAAERGWLCVVLALLDDGTNPHSWSRGSHSAMGSCTLGQNAQSVGGRAIDTADEKGRTPLFYATANGHPHVVAALLARGSDAIHLATSAGRTPWSVTEQWLRHPEFSQRRIVAAIQGLLEKPNTANVSPDTDGEVEEGRIVSAAFFSEFDWDLRQRFTDEFRCHECRALVNDYGERFFCDGCQDDDYGANAEDGFTICAECVAEGVHCLDNGHILQRVSKSLE